LGTLTNTGVHAKRQRLR